MISKNIIFKEEARQAIKRGVDKLANAVKVTLGPMGLNVIVQRHGSPMVTKDGVSVAREVYLQDPNEHLGATLVKEVASRTNDVAGDGTTTATILAQAIIEDGMRVVSAGANPQALRRGMEKAVEAIVAEIKKIAIPVKGTEVENIACISANEKEIGHMVAEAMAKVGENGVISVEEGQSFHTEVEVVKGMQFDKGFSSPYLITNTDHQSCEINDALILVSTQKICTIPEIMPILEKVVESGRKELVIIADDFEAEVLSMLVKNKVHGLFTALAVRAPGFGERRKASLEDIAIMTGARLVSDELGSKLENLNIEDLGRAQRVTSDKDNTTIVEGAGDKVAIENRIAAIKLVLAETELQFDKDKLLERMAKLSGGIAMIRVGAASEAEMREKKHRIEDAVCATRAAVEEGIVAGGGVALIRAREVIPGLLLEGDERLGAQILYRAIESPLRQIAENAGQEGGLVVERVRNATGNQGWNAMTGQIEDMVASGVVDPAKVTRSAIQNAASIAIMILTTECAITDIPEDK